MIDISEVFTVVKTNSVSSQSVKFTISCKEICGYSINNAYVIPLPTVCHPALSANHSETEISLPHQFDLQTWFMRSILSCAHHIQNANNLHHCPACKSETQINMQLFSAPPFLHIEVPEDLSNRVIPHQVLTVPYQTNVKVYRISSIVYRGDLHFWIRIIAPDGNIWIYDGQRNGSRPFQEVGSSLAMHQQWQTPLNHVAYVYIYKLDD